MRCLSLWRIKFYSVTSILIFIFFLKAKSQIAVVRIDCDFDKNFINQIVPCKDLSSQEFNKERKVLGIKSIIKLIHGDSLDSLYLKDQSSFQNLIADPPWNHLNYAYIKRYDFDENGILKSYLEFPVSKYLSIEDSAKLNKRHYVYKQEFDTVTSSFYYTDQLLNKTVYYKDVLVYKEELMDKLIWVFDTIKKIYTTRIIGQSFLTTKYYYLPNGLIDYITSNGKIIYKYDYPEKYKTKRTFIDSISSPTEPSIDTLQNVIIRNNSNKIKKSIFYNKVDESFKVIYSVIYDKNGEVVKVKKSEYEGKKKWEDEFYYDCKNNYKDLKLYSTEGSFSNEYYWLRNILFKYNSKGLVEFIEGTPKATKNKRLYRVSISYSYY